VLIPKYFEYMTEFFELPIKLIHIKRDSLNHISNIIFEREDEKLLLFKNEMIDLAERIEEGCLELEKVSKDFDLSGYKKILLNNQKSIDTARSTFLYHLEYGNKNPSGLILYFLDQKIGHTIIAGAAPYSLVFLSNLYEDEKQPEYPMPEYTKSVATN